jgi:hypothetical protein
MAKFKNIAKKAIGSIPILSDKSTTKGASKTPYKLKA